jgi:hypothetical protein
MHTAAIALVNINNNISVFNVTAAGFEVIATAGSARGVIKDRFNRDLVGYNITNHGAGERGMVRLTVEKK